jgi:hypothetical protein
LTVEPELDGDYSTIKLTHQYIKICQSVSRNDIATEYTESPGRFINLKWHVTRRDGKCERIWPLGSIGTKNGSDVDLMVTSSALAWR